MIRYYSYLYDIRKLLLQPKYNLKVLQNLEKFPINQDHNLDDYYSKIAVELNKNYTVNESASRFYVFSEKEFYVNSKKYYEIVLLNASDYSSKFDRIVVFSNNYVLPNYAIKANFVDTTINIFNKDVYIKILTKWEVSIRCCEIAKFLKLTGKSKSNLYSSTSEYRGLMKFLTENLCNINDLIDFNDIEFQKLKKLIISNSKNPILMNTIEHVRNIIQNHHNWSNTLRYLIYKMNNVIFNKVLSQNCNYGLYIDSKCFPFEKMPFVSSLPSHNPSIYDLLDSINSNGREHEIFVKHLLRKSSYDNSLYFKINNNNKKCEMAIDKYNSMLFHGHSGRRIEKFRDRYFHKESEEATKYIIEELIKFENGSMPFYDAIVNNFFNKFPNLIDSDEKKTIVNNLFKNSRIAIINGAVGTGKTTLLSYIPKLFDTNMMVLCVTNTALNNLRDKLGDSRNITYKTISSIANAQVNYETDLLIIDECSTVNNFDFKKVLEKINCKCIILAGDVYQIEAIEFGNWFNMAQCFVNNKCCYTLTYVHRSSNKYLKNLWEKVRNCDETISETICRHSFSEPLGDSIFTKLSDDEVVLCLNYNGLYGVNNINNISQQMNNNQPYYWNNMVYKIDDPIIFNECNRFTGYIKNNQKGKIVRIEKFNDRIVFLYILIKSSMLLDALTDLTLLIWIIVAQRLELKFEYKVSGTCEQIVSFNSREICYF